MNEQLLIGAKLWIFANDGGRLVDLYMDPKYKKALPNPVIANSAGRFPDIYVAETDISALLKTYEGVTLLDTSARGGNPFSDLAAVLFNTLGHLISGASK